MPESYHKYIRDMKDYNTWVELSRSKYFDNLDFLKENTSPETRTSLLLKANAYGHGWREMYLLAREWGADNFCVFSLDEAINLRDKGRDFEILTLGPLGFKDLEEAINNNIIMGVYDVDTINLLNEAAHCCQTNARIHLNMETGFTRQGVDKLELEKILNCIKNKPLISLEGVYTHFSTADDPFDQSYLNHQIECFEQMVSLIKKNGLKKIALHAANSAAMLARADIQMNMTRIGIMQYGLWPSSESREYFLKNKQNHNSGDAVSPVLSWKTKVVQIKILHSDTLVGYGGTYKAKKGSTVAVLPVGYADGFDRGLSNRGNVLIKGHRAPIIGRISMNLTVVDVTGIPGVNVGEEVVLIGVQGSEEISADEVSELIETINYEVVTRISPRIPKIIV